MLNIAFKRRLVERLRSICAIGNVGLKVALESFDEERDLLVSLETSEATLSAEDGHTNPTTDHGAVAPPGNATGRAPDRSHEILDRVGSRERSGESHRKSELQRSECLFKSLVERGGSVLVAVAAERVR